MIFNVSFVDFIVGWVPATIVALVWLYGYVLRQQRRVNEFQVQFLSERERVNHRLEYLELRVIDGERLAHVTAERVHELERVAANQHATTKRAMSLSGKLTD